MVRLAYPFSIYLTILMCVVPGCQQQQQDDGIPPALQTAIDAFYAAIEEGDGEARIAMFTEDAIMMPSHWTRYEGKAAIAAVVRAGEGSVFRIRDRKVLDIDVSGDLAYTVNSYFYTWHSDGAEPQWHKTKNVHIWKRNAEGQWKLHVDIWNSDVPMAEFPNE
jgi:ketosteroid isomerase-like protein